MSGLRKCRSCGTWHPPKDGCADCERKGKVKQAREEVIKEQAPILEKLVDEQTLRHLTTTGVKHDGEKPNMALIPALAEEEEAHVWTFGAKKYGVDNWRSGIHYRRIIAAAQRHLTEIKKGIDVDPETGRLHAAHVRCCMAMLIEFEKAGRTDLDDRK